MLLNSEAWELQCVAITDISPLVPYFCLCREDRRSKTSFLSFLLTTTHGEKEAKVKHMVDILHLAGLLS